MGLTRKQIIMLAVLVFGTFVTVLNQTVVAPVLPSVMAEMSVDAATAQWLTTGFTLVNAIMIPTTAFLVDRFTTRSLFLVSMAVFTVGSALAAWGPNFGVLLGGRLVQAVGAGILMPLVMTVLMWTFPVSKRGTAMGLFGIVIAFGPAIGPTAAGIIIDRATWHDMFFIIAGLSIAVILVGLFTLERGGETNKDVRLDVPSVILSTLGFGGLLYGLSLIGSYGISIDSAVGTVVGVVGIVAFFRRQLRMDHPMLQVRVLQNRKFLIATIIGMIVQGALLAAGILVPILLQSYMGYSATASGLVLLPGAIIMGAMGPVAGRLFDRHGPRALSVIGTGVLTLTTIAFCFSGPNTTIIGLAILYTIRLFSLSLVNMPITTWGMNALPNDLVNHGTSVNNTLRQVAGSLGTAIIISASTIATNLSAPHIGQTAANFLGIDMAFVVASVLCLIAFGLVVAFVKNKPGEACENDADNARRTVLEAIMKRDVFTLPETAKVSEAMKLLVDKGVSAVPLVNAAGEATGFISDGDIMRNLSKRSTMMMDPIVMIMQMSDADGSNKDFVRKLETLMDMPASAIGSKGIIGVDVHADLPEVCRVLGENHLKKVPVLDDGRIVGVINRSDITHYSMERYLAGRTLTRTPDGEESANDDAAGERA
ncbi:MDR family MFS transporter [Xiamenia xianingshaonis]|uniref:DHA2 family efflux MFS transporter permease subunit n=1 Tax=Xiamenia xianingshaonis TaxID=2682776 RepID=A0A9E6MQT6_9ACTN|nr:MDR family MFS transporter [Xiamenia xianingshaonis]NHM14668.1 DHA2 family efflux MFS transporter permease subunit [Xiamenia xianingshaonis]QTU84297.1 DHA2 family efflux MFS transporter permease subunit [Xiamenia xianingshaonis]